LIGSPTSGHTAKINNLYSNATNVLKTGGSPTDLVNNWWGTVACTNILKTVIGSSIDYIPYRLFGPFDLKEGADVMPPDMVASLSKYKPDNTLYLTWNKVTNSDLDHYNVYVSSMPAFSNLSPADIRLKTTATNCTVPAPNSFVTYIHITASDNHLVYTNESWYSLTMALTNNIVIRQQYIPSYQTTLNCSNQAVMAFEYRHMNSLSLTNLALTNTGTMVRNADHSSNLQIYYDLSPYGVFEKGTDVYCADLFWSMGKNQWTNNMLSLSNNSRILITMDILSGPTRSRTFRTRMTRIADSYGTNYPYTVTGPVVTIDNTAPLFSGSFTGDTSAGNTISLQWDSASDNCSAVNKLRYHIYLEPSQGTGLSGSSLVRSVTNANILVLSNRNSSSYYFLIEASDEMDNRTLHADEISVTFTQVQSDLKNVLIGPNPYKPYDYSNVISGKGMIFSGLTSDAKIEIYTILGRLIATLKEQDGDGVCNWKVPENIASGMYICRISNSKGQSMTRKIMIIK
ncbi:MAG: T9SS type A sorting domain-containing protein, partial [bacterium]|nr:T9SS type A sorting domain-containing protein [bacterium]